MIFVTTLLFLLFNILSVMSQDLELKLPFSSLEETLSEEEGHFESGFEGEIHKLICSTLDECHQIIQQYKQENSALWTELAKYDEMDCSPKQRAIITQNSSEDKKAQVVKNTFLSSNVQGNQYTFTVDSKDLPATFYIRAIGTSRQYPGLYVTADCDASCFGSSSFTQIPSSSMYCWRGTNEVLAESTFSLSLSSPCTIYYSVGPGTVGESVETTIWLYKPRMLASNSQNTLFFPFNNTARYFVHVISQEQVPSTFYIRAVGANRKNPSIYVTSDCSNACFDSPSFTEFPSPSHYCESGTAFIIDEVTYSFTLNTACKIYYSILSSDEGESVTVTTWLFKTAILSHTSKTSVFFPFNSDRNLVHNSQNTLFFPFNNTARYFVHVISQEQVPSTFYIRAVGTNRKNPSIYVTSDCSNACFDSPSFTEFPSSSHYCESGTALGLDEATYALSLNSACKIYYSILSSDEGESVTVSIWIFKTAALSPASKTSLFFPFKDSIRYFVHNIEPSDVPSTFYIQAIGDNRKFSAIYVTVDCNPSCFKANYFTNFPTQSSSCWGGTQTILGETTFSFSVTKTCKIYYGISSSEEGVSVEATVWLFKTEALGNESPNSLFFPFKNSDRYFFQNIGSSDVPSTFYIQAVGSNDQLPVIYVTTDCIRSCFETDSFTEFPSSESYCETGVNEDLTVSIYSISLTTKCKIYYSIWSKEGGKSVTVNIWMNKSDINNI